jgi:hypothetical protein
MSQYVPLGSQINENQPLPPLLQHESEALR